MIVFKTILKITNKLKGMLILYTVMLILITVLNQTSSNNKLNFEEVKPDIAIINKDSKNIVTDGLIDYLSKHCNIKKVNIEDIDDAIFYRDISFALYIYDGFKEDLLNNKNVELEYKSDLDSYSSYTFMLVSKYIKQISLYKDYYSEDELINKVNNVLDKDIKVEMKTKLDKSKLSSMTRYFNFLNYSLLAGCVYCISMVLSILNSENVKKRTIISSFNYSSYNKIVLISNFIVIFSIWLLYILLSIILFKDLMISQNGIAYIINSFVFSMCSLTIGFLIGSITQNKSAIGGIINVVALGTSFLCGCFVPFEYMPSYVIKISKILPTYYYVRNNEMISSIEIFNLDNIIPLLVNIIIIIIFGILFILITNRLNKKNRIIN